MSVLMPQMCNFFIVIKLFFSISPTTMPVIGLNRDLSVHLPSSQITDQVCAADQSFYSIV